MKEESLLLLSELQKLINQVVLIDYTIIILGGTIMNPVSIIILLLIIAYCAFVIYKQVQKKKQGGCGGNCAGCSGCSSFQANDPSAKKKGR